MKEKNASMQKIIDGHKTSAYYNDAMFQIANSHLVGGENEDALKMYKQIVAEYPNSKYVKQSLLAIGLIYYNNKENEIE